MKNLIQRAVTGLLFVAILVGAILYGPFSFMLLFMLISALAVWEFSCLVNKQENVHVNSFIAAGGGVLLFLAFFGYSLSYWNGISIFVPYLLILIYMFVSELYLKRSNPINNWAYSIMSQIYVALPFALLCVLAFMDMGYELHYDTVAYNGILPLSVFIFNWSNDTGAYCTGMLFGRHRLFERISPKKSWEGSIGGGVISILVALIMAHYFPFLSTFQWIGFALVVVVFGTWGDLVESLLKRQLGIKDSGNILPGHGGMLDRFDSTLLAVPAVIVYLLLVKMYISD